jgi:hypothetical protein
MVLFSNQTVFSRNAGCRFARRHAQLGVDPVKTRVHRAGRDAQGSGDFLGAVPLALKTQKRQVFMGDIGLLYQFSAHHANPPFVQLHGQAAGEQLERQVGRAIEKSGLVRAHAQHAEPGNAAARRRRNDEGRAKAKILGNFDGFLLALGIGLDLMAPDGFGMVAGIHQPRIVCKVGDLFVFNAPPGVARQHEAVRLVRLVIAHKAGENAGIHAHEARGVKQRLQRGRLRRGRVQARHHATYLGKVVRRFEDLFQRPGRTLRMDERVHGSLA